MEAVSAERKAAAGAAAVEVAGVSRIFGSGAEAVRALDRVSVTIAENEFFTLLGPSGCGKTTLLRLIAGFDHPSEGAILLRGEDISSLPPYARSVNTVFQSYALFPHMTVAQNIGFGLEMLGWPRAEIRDEVARMLALVKMEALSNRATAEISGGQQQRVALARALAPRPSVLLLDEPLSALDYKLRKEMQGELKRLQHETGITFVFVTHDQEEALTMSDRIAVMSGGRILQIGTPREIYDHPQERFVADFIGDTNFLPARVREAQGAGLMLALDAGCDLHLGPGAGTAADGARVTVAVRPEHAALAAPGTGSLDATVAQVTYVGTDTHYRLTLPDGSDFYVRAQNRRDAAAQAAPGQTVGLLIPPDAAQVLRD